MGEREPGRGEAADDLFELLSQRARRTPEAPAVLMPGAPPLTYGALYAAVRAGVGKLTAWGVERADRVVVPATDDVDCVVTLLAVMCAAVCCPVDPGLAQEEFEASFDVLEPTSVVLTAGASDGLRRAAGTSDLAVLEHDGRLGAADGGRTARILPAGRELAPWVAGESVLLHTSGTISSAKIVPLGMAAMLASAAASTRAYRLTPADRRLNLTPLFRVQGLVGGLITTLVSGSSTVCVPAPDPAQVLTLLAELEPTWFSGTPMTLRALLDRAGGGPVRAPRLRFVRSGAAPMPPSLRREIEARFGVPLVESYGMSEAPQIACTPLPPDRPARGMLPSASRIGVLGANGRVRTVPGARGEIVVRGANVIERYMWPTQANSCFVNGWLRTGDLGELAGDGSLVVVGRVGELIDLDGRSVVPSEVEDALLRHPAIGSAVVFGVPDGAVRRVAAAVVPRPGRTVDEQSVRAFAAEHLASWQVPERVVVRGELPLGAAGKVVRCELPELLGVSFAAPTLVSVPPLPNEAVEPSHSAAPRFAAAASRVPRLAALPDRPVSTAVVAVGAPDGDVVVPPTPIAYWLRERGGEIGGFHQSRLLRVPARLGHDRLARALQAVLDRHDVLRARLRADCALAVSAPGAVDAHAVVARIDAAGLDREGLRAVVAERSRAEVAALDPHRAAMIRVTWFDAGPRRQGRLLVTAHHLAVDGVSWRILLADLRAAWLSAGRGGVPRLAPVPTSPRQRGERLNASAAGPERVGELSLWRAMSDAGDVPLTRAGLDPRRDVYATAGSLTVSLAGEFTGPLLDGGPAAHGTGVREVLLTGLALAVPQWRRTRRLGGGTGVLVDLEVHGRERAADDCDLSRTVGRVAAPYPVALDAGIADWDPAHPDGPRLDEALRRVTARLRDVPDHGAGYGVLRHLDPAAGAELAALPTPQIGFDYLGGPAVRGERAHWRTAPESDALPGLRCAPAPLPHAIEVSAAVEERAEGPRLVATWTWPARLLTEHDVRELAAGWLAALRALISVALGRPGR